MVKTHTERPPAPRVAGVSTRDKPCLTTALIVAKPKTKTRSRIVPASRLARPRNPAAERGRATPARPQQIPPQAAPTPEGQSCGTANAPRNAPGGRSVSGPAHLLAPPEAQSRNGPRIAPGAALLRLLYTGPTALARCLRPVRLLFGSEDPDQSLRRRSWTPRRRRRCGRLHGWRSAASLPSRSG